MKRILKIVLIVAIAVYFIGNVLPNLIGVPLAAYHSYQSWQEVGQDVNHEDFHVKDENETPEISKDSIQIKEVDSLSDLNIKNN